VCPLRKRGSDYVVNGNLVTGVDPSISGYISYGFNEVGVFDRMNSSGNMEPLSSVKVSEIAQPSQMVAIGDCSGGNSPAGDNGPQPGSVWDSVWMARSGPNGTGGGTFNYRFQTSYARHNNRANILYTDGHVAPALPSSLTYGQFVGVFGSASINLTGAGGSIVQSTSSVSSPALDAQVWSPAPE
jgi:prepilin-type processing-associated H-X9-DG protein